MHTLNPGRGMGCNSDTPFSLAASVLEVIPVLTGTDNTGFAWSIYTGDIASHDPENQLSRWVVFSYQCGAMHT
jgi:hypothetical protein